MSKNETDFEISAHDLNEMTLSAAECLVWSECDENGNPFTGDLSAEALESIRDDVANFASLAAAEITASSLSPEQVGHDFTLTRNGHGAGFWDRGLGELGERLSSLAKSFGSVHVYMSDTGTLEVE